MSRLAAEGVVGADAIFACLGPALEIFSRYRRVEKANGETATLREYLEFVWAAVSTEALALIFHDADAAGLEPDARLPAMWLWTLGGNAERGVRSAESESEDEAGDDAEDESHSAFRIPHSALRTPHSALRTPHSFSNTTRLARSRRGWACIWNNASRSSK